VIKYYVLIAMLAAASGGLLAEVFCGGRARSRSWPGRTGRKPDFWDALVRHAEKVASGWKANTPNGSSALLFNRYGAGNFLSGRKSMVASSIADRFARIRFPLIHRSIIS